MESPAALPEWMPRAQEFQFGHGGEPWSHWRSPFRFRKTFCSFNSATAVSRGVTMPELADAVDVAVFQFGHGGEPWSHRLSTSS